MVKRPWRSVDADLFRFSTTDLRELHVAVMAAFDEAAVLAPALNLDQVRAALTGLGWDDPLSDDALQRALAALTQWGLLEATQDHSARYTTPEEFERRNLQWSLTPRGEAAITGLLHALESLRAAVGLQTAVLDAIGDDLAELVALLAGPRTADARIHVQLTQVERHLASLVASVRQFNGHLQRLLREDGTNDDVFADVKRRTVNYLEEYVEGIERPQRRLVSLIEQLEALGPATLFDRALAGANLAPVSDSDPGPAWLAERERHWRALRAWFVPTGASPPLVRGLVDVARTAIIELLRVLERRWDSRRRAASIGSDFRALARLCAQAPGDDEAHRLFAAAVGLWPSRHAHLAPVDGQARAPAVSWLAAEPVEVAPALRSSGSLANKGHVRPVADPALIRAKRQREQAEALAAHEALRASLASGRSVALSSFGVLDPEAFAELLDLLAVGLAAPRASDGLRRALSADGRVEVVLIDPGHNRAATITTPAGTFRGPDLAVTITLLDAEDDERREAAGG